MLKRKERILISAIELLYEGGTNNVTTKNLAKKEGITEPALYRQYKNKHEISKAIVLEYSAYDQQIFDTIVQSKLAGKEALFFFIKRYCEYYASYKEITTVFYSMDLYKYSEELNDIMKATIDKRKAVLKSIIESCELNFQMSSDVIASVIHGLIMSQLHDWIMFNYEFDLSARVLEAVEQFLGFGE